MGAVRSARASARARIETQHHHLDAQDGLRSARASARARIETYTPDKLRQRSGVAPAPRRGRGLKHVVVVGVGHRAVVAPAPRRGRGLKRP